MIKVKRISHATFETPDLERLTAYYTGVIGLAPLEREKDRVLFVSRLGDISIILHRGSAPNLTKIAFEVSPHDDLFTHSRFLSDQGIRSSVDRVSLPGIDRMLVFQDPKGTTIEIFNEKSAAAPVSEPVAVGPTRLGHIAFMMPDIHPFVTHFLKACTVFARQAAMLDRPLGTTYTIDITGGLFGDTGYGDVTFRILSEPTSGVIPAAASIIGRGTHPGSDEPEATPFEEDDERPRRRAKTVSE